MIDKVRWPGPPFRLTRMVRASAIIIRCCVILLVPMAILLILFALLFASGRSEELIGVYPAEESGFSFWFPILLLIGIGCWLLWFCRGMWARARLRADMAERSDQIRLVDADLLAMRSNGKGLMIWTYGFAWRGHRWHGEQLMAVDPLILDDLLTRSATLVMPDGSGELLARTGHPVKMDKPERARVLSEAAAAAALRSSPGDLASLEARLEGKARIFVELYRRACEEEDPKKRRRLAYDRLSAASGLKREEIDRLLVDCRRHAASHPVGPVAVPS